MTEARYVVGIDLGTTHCVMAASPSDRVAVELVEIPQLVAPGELAHSTVLPSFLYLPAEGEFPPGDLALPWGRPSYAVGEIARRLGARTPTRLVASAKSWICYGGVNRRAPILPWSAPDSERHVSPYEASVVYLSHLRSAWDRLHPDAPLARQDVVVTVPASFDEGARELTAAAAQEAGLGTVCLLEEPQAAFYDFLAERSEDLRALLREAKLVLVVDVGGGTTDLTLLKAIPNGDEESPVLERIAVGGHLLLGGDNMDAALAHLVLDKAKLERALDPSEWSALMLAARVAKEQLLGPDAPEEVAIPIQRRGSRLVGNTLSQRIGRDEARSLLVDGFLPLTGREEVAARGGRAGFTSMGLPYVTDTAISRHVCTFLRRHAEAARAAGARVDQGLPRPDLVLLNGGVFNAPALVERFAELMKSWFGEGVPVLAHGSLESSVARGAVRYGLARRGLGRLIGGGTARAYYVGVDGEDGTRRALCVAPRGMEPGTTVEVSGRKFELLLERPVVFPLYGYTGDRIDAAGTLVPCDDEELETLAPLETILRNKGERSAGTERRTVLVTLSATVTERGMLEIYLTSVERPVRRWRLSFALADAGGSDVSGTSSASSVARAWDETLPPRFAEAREKVRVAFGHGGDARAVERAKSLRSDLEAVLGQRGGWSAATCRALADVLLSHRDARAHSVAHELTWLRLVGWCLRPGAGAPGDPERIGVLWPLYSRGPVHPNKGQWTEWWILWRRVSAGLDRAQQMQIFEDVRRFFAPEAGSGATPRPPGQTELLQLLAALERLPASKKELIGDWFFQRAAQIGSYWVLGRLGARVLFHGERDSVVPPSVAEAWIEKLLALDWRRVEGAAFASVLMARVTGDRERDVGEAIRRRVAARLEEISAPASWLAMVTRGGTLSTGDLGRWLGEALPAGLRLSGW